MNALKHTIPALAILPLLLLPVFASAAEIHILPSGEFSVKGLSVFQKSGSNLFTRASWGNTFIRVIVLVNSSTAIVKNYGEKATVDDIKEGQILDVDGTLAASGDNMVVNATRVRNTSLLRESKTISGVVRSIDSGALSIVVPNTLFGTTTVSIGASVPIKKGARTISFGDIAVGDKVVSVSGTYDYQTGLLTATTLEIFQDKTMFKARNFEGTLKSISATTLPATLVVTVGGTDYSVYLAKTAKVLKKNRGAATLGRFVVDDTVRFYGAVRQTAFTEIDAEIVRDLNF
ncbi:MAG: hypothetical protein AAB665_02445 [Patescibacteria group bacterium]